MSDKEQRLNPRFSCCGLAQVQLPEDTTSYRAKIRNLSLEGCQVELMEEAKVEDELLDLTFTVNQLPFRIRGQIRYIHADKTLGVKFMQFSSRAHRQLLDLLRELEEDEAKCHEDMKAAS